MYHCLLFIKAVHTVHDTCTHIKNSGQSYLKSSSFYLKAFIYFGFLYLMPYQPLLVI